MLCRRCKELFWDLEAARKGDVGKIPYHRPARSPNLKLRQSCNACAFLYRSNRDLERIKTEIIWQKRTRTDYALVFNVYDSKDPGSRLNKTYFQVTRIDPRHGTDRLRFGINQQTAFTGSNTCFSLARDWIENCRENHTKCSEYQRTVRRDWNPTRLVEIDKEGICSKLCEGNQIPASVPYATLSHCWGKICDKIVLTKENKASFQKALPESDLPQTFKDAITAARMLGFDYIWIDSLCIIQNSRDDWLNESSQMSEVYEYSTLTITATSSKDDNGGCFFSRDTKDTFPIRISVGPKNGCNRRQNIRSKVRRPRTTVAPQIVFDLNCLATIHWNNDVENAPINERGWVLQERFLSPRLLHFSKYQLYWECNEMLASESYPVGMSTFEPEHFHSSSRQSAKLPSTVASPAPPIAGRMLQALPLDLQRLFRTNVIRTWMDVIEHYTRRGLTKKTDKLPAISAVARRAFDIQKCDYLAGLWKNDLVYELGWMPDFSELPSEIPGEGHEVQWDDATYSQEPYFVQVLYRAPSWSWASVDGQVTYAYNNDNIGTGNNHPLIEYVGHEIKLSNAKDLYGEVMGGYLTVKAQTIMVTLTESPPVVGPQLVSQTTQVSVNEHIVNTQGNVYRDDLNGIFAPDPHNVLAMPLLLSFSLSSGFLLTCLLLEEKEQNVYKRIGALNWQSKKAKLESDSGLKQIMSKLGKIEWDVGSYIRFERDTTQLQEIKIV